MRSNVDRGRVQEFRFLSREEYEGAIKEMLEAMRELNEGSGSFVDDPEYDDLVEEYLDFCTGFDGG